MNERAVPLMSSLASESLRATTRRVLHVGCGPRNPMKLNRIFREPGWQEVRLDIDPNVEPDILASITDMSAVPSESVDAVWSSHNIEHLFAHEVPTALAEFHRVLVPGGLLLITLPDLEAVARVILEQGADKVLMTSTDGTVPITPIDMIYGWGFMIQHGRTYMAHRTGFTLKTLGNAILAAGFPQVQAARGKTWDLWCLARKGCPVDNPDLLPMALS